LEEPEVCYAEGDGGYDGETIVALDMRVRNNADRDIEFYPDQAVLVLGDEQVDEAMLLGPDQIGGTIRAGTRSDGQAWWLSEQSVNELRELGRMRLIISTPYWLDDFEGVTDESEIDLTVTW
jgi:hypothetical protein